MRLKSFRVLNYKSIMDSGQVQVDPQVTCLLGKNESGKSATMQALWKSRNAVGARFDPLNDLPAELFAKSRNINPEVVVLDYLLETHDRESFTQSFPEISSLPEFLTVRSTYSGESISVEMPGEQPASNSDFHELLKLWTVDRLPTFIYFDDYGRLRSRIHLPTFTRDTREEPQDKEARSLFRTQAALFQWAGLSPDELQQLGQPQQPGEIQDDVERRKGIRSRLLESASHTVSGAWLDWWDQREHKLEFSADGEDLELRVSDDVNPWKIPFSERSHGLQWFLSFYLTYLAESEKAPQGAILLLDEPGLHLHPTQQLKLLAFFRTISETHQIIYSTHSLFMIDPDYVDNVRTVYLQGKENGHHRLHAYTHIAPTSEPKGDFDTILPLRAAGAYHLSKTVTLGKRTLIVGDLSHYWMLVTLAHSLRSFQHQTLHPDTVVLWTGATRNIFPLADAVKNGRNGKAHEESRLSILMDNSAPGLKMADHLVGLLTHEHATVLSIGQILEMAQAQIEDLVEPNELLESMRRMGRNPAGNAVPQQGETNVPFLQRLFSENGWGEFSQHEQAKIILKLTDAWRTGSPPPAKATLDRAKKVFTAVNQCFS